MDGWQVLGTLAAALLGSGAVAKFVADVVAKKVASKIAVEQETELRTKVKALEAKLDRALELRTRVEEGEWKAVTDFAAFFQDCVSDLDRMALRMNIIFEGDAAFDRDNVVARHKEAVRFQALLASEVVSDAAFREDCVNAADKVRGMYVQVGQVFGYGEKYLDEHGYDEVNDALREWWKPARKAWEPAYRAWRAKHLEPRDAVA